MPHQEVPGVKVDDPARSHEKKRSSKPRRKDKDRSTRDRSRDRDKDKDSTASSRRHHPTTTTTHSTTSHTHSHQQHRHKSSSRVFKSSRPTTASETHSHASSHHKHRTAPTTPSSSARRNPKLPKDELRDQDSVTNGPTSNLTASDIVPELSRRFPSQERVNLSYPSLNKTYSKEAIYSKEDLSTPQAPRPSDPLTPEPTDLGSANLKRSPSSFSSCNKSPAPAASRNTKMAPQEGRPPSPPQTDLSAARQSRGHSDTPASSSSLKPDDAGEGTTAKRTQSRNSALSRSSTKSSKSAKSTSKKSSVLASSLACANDETLESDVATATPTLNLPRPSSRTPSAQTAKPIAVEDASSHVSPESVPDLSSPRTPIQEDSPSFPPPPPPLLSHAFKGCATPSGAPGPPPPPPVEIQAPPRVDYLLRHGGLSRPVPKQFLAVLPRQNGTRPSNPPLRGTETLFAPFFHLLDQYHSVLKNHGSVAVATGSRTIARRLLDRLENVFSRDLPPEGCSCLVCERSDELSRGLGWGEVLERVCGRMELPPWPPFDLASLGPTKAAAVMATVPARPASPVKIDPDIAEEFREQYLRQSKRSKAAVDQWMSNCAGAAAPLPSDVDDETLAFAIMTNLDPDDQPYFNALLSGRELRPTVRAPTPMRQTRTEFVVRMGLSLQRLYRLHAVPRDPETVVYLVRHRHMHDLLYTMADISPPEWEILTSGRFDGFLWSGADTDTDNPTDGLALPSRPTTMSPGLARSASAASAGVRTRNTTPFSLPSRGTTPASFVSIPGVSRTAVSNDEETEIAVLNEVERQIFAGMETLEDAFELLHERAETVRTALRQRSASLSVSLQQRRATLAGAGGFGAIHVLPGGGLDARVMGGYGYGCGDDESFVSEGDDWGGDDLDSLAPDDSASNISSSRHRRPKRRTQRRTPAPIEEDEDEY